MLRPDGYYGRICPNRFGPQPLFATQIFQSAVPLDSFCRACGFVGRELKFAFPAATSYCSQEYGRAAERKALP